MTRNHKKKAAEERGGDATPDPSTSDSRATEFVRLAERAVRVIERLVRLVERLTR